MADIYQRVFMILVRPYYGSDEDKTFPSSGIAHTYMDGELKSHTLYTTNHALDVDTLSPTNLNDELKFKLDIWCLHSTYTSYEMFKEALKTIIADYGTSRVKCASYIPIDYCVLPSE